MTSALMKDLLDLLCLPALRSFLKSLQINDNPTAQITWACLIKGAVPKWRQSIFRYFGPLLLVSTKSAQPPFL